MKSRTPVENIIPASFYQRYDLPGKPHIASKRKTLTLYYGTAAILSSASPRRAATKFAAMQGSQPQPIDNIPSNGTIPTLYLPTEVLQMQAPFNFSRNGVPRRPCAFLRVDCHSALEDPLLGGSNRTHDIQCIVPVVARHDLVEQHGRSLHRRVIYNSVQMIVLGRSVHVVAGAIQQNVVPGSLPPNTVFDTTT